MLSLIDPPNITVPSATNKEVGVIACHIGCSCNDIVLTGMGWERVGAACLPAKTFVKLNPRSIYTLMQTEHCTAQNDAEAAQVSMKFIYYYPYE